METRGREEGQMSAGHTHSEVFGHKGNSRQRGPGVGNTEDYFLVGVGNLDASLELTTSARLAEAGKPVVEFACVKLVCKNLMPFGP